MKTEICRAITFINYHIPQDFTRETDDYIEYTTAGFFDGLCTECLDLEYQSQSLTALWKYTLKCTSRSKGQYSYQNIFCFSHDDWNDSSDAIFWSDETNDKYPLTFIVFLQLRNYVAGNDKIERQCHIFHDKVKETLLDRCMVYTYATVDKNDFVICIKSQKYIDTVNAIKNLHTTGYEVIYSYTVFAVSNKTLENFTEKNYPEAYNEQIPSICLKGITNSFDPGRHFTLDKKYYEFCRLLVNALYDTPTPEDDFKIYDILGDDDFRLIARWVKLGKLLRQYSSDGLLNYRNYKFYLFSSNLILNTLTTEYADFSENDMKSDINTMTKRFRSPLSNQLQSKMLSLTAGMQNISNDTEEKIVTFCHAIWQLLQSLKALETAPTKQYDFLSLYIPFSLFVQIMEEKMNQYQLQGNVDFADNNEIYEFIHKISMTLHGTLRTDIQFFQIRDFNVIVHYAPAKLRAFFAFWTLRLSTYYDLAADPKNKYSFILAPGMFQEICVRELFTEPEVDKRLMLITLPERFLYLCDQLLIILAHEVSHFVGYTIRNRPVRHQTWSFCCGRILTLELKSFQYFITGDDRLLDLAFCWITKESCLQTQIEKNLQQALTEVNDAGAASPHQYHSKNSMYLINLAFEQLRKEFLEKIITDECTLMETFFKTGLSSGTKLRFEQESYQAAELRKNRNNMEDQMHLFYQKFVSLELRSILDILKEISTEAYADLNAVLTLSLSPEKYILSFVNNDIGFRWFKEHSLSEGGPLLVVRISLVLYTTLSVVSENEEWFCQNYPEFFKNWKTDLLKDLPEHFPENTTAHKLSCIICEYVDGIQDKTKIITDYQSLYNPEDQQFSNNKFDFLNDLFIWKALTDYLLECAKSYVGNLRSSPSVIREQQALSAIFSSIGGNSPLDMIQTVEEFLMHAESIYETPINKQ